MLQYDKLHFAILFIGASSLISKWIKILGQGYWWGQPSWGVEIFFIYYKGVKGVSYCYIISKSPSHVYFSGTFGQAWLSRHLPSGHLCVVKSVATRGLSEKDKEQALNEVSVLARCRHVNVIRYRDAFVTMTTLNIAMEYADKGEACSKYKLVDDKDEGCPKYKLATGKGEGCSKYKLVTGNGEGCSKYKLATGKDEGCSNYKLVAGNDEGCSKL